MTMTNAAPNLDTILDAKRRDLARRKRKTPIDAVRALASMQRRPEPLLSTVQENERVLLIGQIDYAPPANGVLDGHDPVAQAVHFARAGVDTIALFTDRGISSGGVEDLMFIARAVRSFNVPVITQNYIFDEYQVIEARAAGAAGVVLSAGMVDLRVLRILVSSTQRNRMTAIVEVANEAELASAIALSPQVIAFSNRSANGGDWLTAARRLRPLVPRHVHIAVSGGVGSFDEMAQVAALGVDAVFVDTPLLAPDNVPILRDLLRSSAG
mgnify:CR=1 FL=1